MLPRAAAGPVSFWERQHGDTRAGMEADMWLVLLAGGAGGFCLATGQAVMSYRAITSSDSPQIGVFLMAQIIPLFGLTIMGAIVAWATSSEPISSFLTGLTALGFVLVLAHGAERNPNG